MSICELRDIVVSWLLKYERGLTSSNGDVFGNITVGRQQSQITIFMNRNKGHTRSINLYTKVALGQTFQQLRDGS